MFNQTDLDVRYAEHIARNARVDRHGWMTDGPPTLGALPGRGAAGWGERTRRRIGETLIGVGKRMQGTSVVHATTAALKGFGPAV